MTIVNAIPLQSNKKSKINSYGGDLSLAGRILLIKEFIAQIGLIKLLRYFALRQS